MGSRRDYLFKRPGSENWYVRFQRDGKSIEKSLRTTSRGQAEIAALPMIAQHKAVLLAAKPQLEQAWLWRLPPGQIHTLPDGAKVMATDRELMWLDDKGVVVSTKPNGGPGYVAKNLPDGWG